MKIDIGCGKSCKAGYDGLDRTKFKGVKYVVDLEKQKLPFKNNTIDNIYSNMFFEHVNNPLDIIVECNRVLKKMEFLNLMYLTSHTLQFITQHTKIFGTYIQLTYLMAIITKILENGVMLLGVMNGETQNFSNQLNYSLIL